MRKILIILGLFSFCAMPFQGLSQDMNVDGDWETLLNDVKIRNFYSAKYHAYIPVPRFGNDLKELEGKKITLQGFYLPYNYTGDTAVVSYYPMDMCFFCTGSGIQTLVEAHVSEDDIKKFGRLRTDNIIKVSGVLKLNDSDFDHLIYILKDTELLEIVK